MTLPRRFGGLEIDPLGAVDVVERLSYADGAAGWCGFIGNSTSFFGWLEPEVTLDILTGAPHVAAASIFAPSGQAVSDGKGGYTVDGRWGFASGSGHSEWSQVGVLVMDGERPGQRADGGPDWRFAYLPTSDLTIVDNWDTLGLRGTGSNDVVAQGATVTAEQLAMPMFDEPKADDAIFRLGFWGLISLLMAPHPLGVARRALDELELVLPTKTPPPGRAAVADDPQVHYEIGRARAQLSSARAYLDDATGRAWATVATRDTGTEDDRRMLGLALQNAMATALEVVDVSYRFAGSAVVQRDNLIQRCFRDVHTARMHIAFGLDGYRGAGRHTLGRE